MSFRPAWCTQKVQEHPELHNRQTLPQETKTKQKRKVNKVQKTRQQSASVPWFPSVMDCDGTCKSNKAFPPQVIFDHEFYHSKTKQTGKVAFQVITSSILPPCWQSLPIPKMGDF